MSKIENKEFGLWLITLFLAIWTWTGKVPTLLFVLVALFINVFVGWSVYRDIKEKRIGFGLLFNLGVIAWNSFLLFSQMFG